MLCFNLLCIFYLPWVVFWLHLAKTGSQKKRKQVVGTCIPASMLPLPSGLKVKDF